MTTIAQLETFYWVCKLGSLQACAEKLHVTASAISKRLNDLNCDSTSPLCHVHRKGLDITTEGRRVLSITEELLKELSELDSLRSSESTAARVVSIGVTELVVMTWFSSFVARLSESYPQVSLIPHVDLSAVIQNKVLEGRLDVAVLPEQYVDDRMTSIRLGAAQFAWFCKPGLIQRRARASLHDLVRFPLIEQGPGSGITTLSRQLFAEAGLAPARVSGSNSMVALVGLIESGLGIACMPEVIAQRSVKAKRLQVIRTNPEAPSIAYYAVFSPEHSSVGWTLAGIARDACDFRKLGWG